MRCIIIYFEPCRNWPYLHTETVILSEREGASHICQVIFKSSVGSVSKYFTLLCYLPIASLTGDRYPAVHNPFKCKCQASLLTGYRSRAQAINTSGHATPSMLIARAQSNNINERVVQAVVPSREDAHQQGQEKGNIKVDAGGRILLQYGSLGADFTRSGWVVCT
jgi:hypothetical protein